MTFRWQPTPESKVSIITGVCLPGSFFGYTPSLYESVPAQPPKPREWVNRDGWVWALTIDYRKESLGEAGVLSTHRTHEGAKRALAEWAGRELTAEELNNGAIYGCDETVEIVEQQLED